METFIRKDARYQPDSQSRLRIEFVRKEVELARLRGTDDSSQRPRAAHVARDTDVKKGRVETSGRSGEPKVAGQCPTQSGARTSAINRRDSHGRHFMKE